MVGAPRSGTTLLRVILDRHPKLAMWGGESDFFRRLYDRRAAFGDPGVAANRERIIDAFVSLEPVRRLKLDWSALKQRLMHDGETWPALFAALLQFHADAQGKPYAGEKTPVHAFRTKELLEWFPNCAIVHIVRDPRDAVSSVIRMPWSTRSVQAGARSWTRFNTAALEAAERANYLLAKYEDLVADPKESLTRICRHIGLAYDPALLQANERNTGESAVVARASKPISADRRGLWRKAFQPWQVAAIEDAAGPLMEQFGYAREAPPISAPDRARATAEEIFETAVQKATRLPAGFYRHLQPTNLAAESRWLERASALYWSVRRKPVDVE